MALHDENDDDWPRTNPRSISTFRTFSKASSTSKPNDGIVVPPQSRSVPMPRPLNVMQTPHVSATQNDAYYDLVPDDDDDDEDDLEPPVVMEFTIDLLAADRRFGFSVVGGYDEGFPPRIDEISPGSPADRTELEVGDEILEVNGKSLEDATHTEVISHIHQCIKSRTICLRVKRKTGNKLALDLAQHSNVQDAFVIAVEQQARERLEKLSALQKIKPVDMTKLSKQLSQESSSTTSSQELNGLIEESSPIYVTSVPNLSLSASNLVRSTTGDDNDNDAGDGGRQSAAASHQRNGNLLIAGRGGDLRQHHPRHHPVAGSAPELDLKSSAASGSNGYLAAAADDEVRELKLDQRQPHDPCPSPDAKMKVSGHDHSQLQQQHHEQVGIGVAKRANSENSVSARGGGGGGGGGGGWDEVPHREMAVDVPDSFRGSSKTPPRFPLNSTSSSSSAAAKDKNRTTQQLRGNESLNSSTTSSSSRGGGGGVGTLPMHASAKQPSSDVGIGTRVFTPPSVGGRDSRQRSADVQETSLTADVVGGGNAAAAAAAVQQHPTPAPRTIHSPTPRDIVAPEVKPTEGQLERMRKYQEDIRKRREEEERIHREQDFLRTSLRGSKKLQALEQSPTPSSSASASGFDNSAFLVDDDAGGDRPDDDDNASADVEHGRPSPAPLKRIAGVAELIAALQRVQAHLRANGRGAEGASLSKIDGLLRDPDFQQALKIHNKVQQVCCFRTPPTPLCTDAQGLTQEVLSSLRGTHSAEAAELVELLNRYDVDGLLLAHDTIAKREAVVAMSPDEELLDRASQYTDDSVKIVRIEKTNEPLGATVRNEGEAVIIGRIVKGGVAEKSGLLHEGDEILEVNNSEMRGKSVNDVCDILANMTGTLTFLVVPTQFEQTKLPAHETVMHVKAHFDYDPEDDLYIPCRELGISFRKGDILHIINQSDPNWWQAFREGEDDQSLAGLIPSMSFQQQRAAMEQKIVADSNNRNNDGRSAKKSATLLLCAHKRNTKKAKTKSAGGGKASSLGGGTLMYNASYNVDGIDPLGGRDAAGGGLDDNEILTYEEVALYYPRANRKRPIVLIGPPNIGRHELRQKLMEDVERFAAAVPHTSRPKKDEELDGQDYYFISRQQFELDILGRKFVEHGEYEKNYYGTSLDAIRTVVNSGKICVLNLHPQSLRILKASDLKPFVVYVAPPLLDKLRQNRTKMGINVKDDELKEIIVKAREMDESYGHYFDLVIVNSDLERAYEQLLREINALEREPQWVPAVWLLDEIN